MSSGPINCEPVAKSVPGYAVSSRITYITGCKPHLVMILLLFGSPSPGAGSAGMALTFKGIEPVVSVHEPRPLCLAIPPSHVVSAASSRKSFPVRVPLLSIACHVRRFPMSIRLGVAHKIFPETDFAIVRSHCLVGGRLWYTMEMLRLFFLLLAGSSTVVLAQQDFLERLPGCAVRMPNPPFTLCS